MYKTVTILYTDINAMQIKTIVATLMTHDGRIIIDDEFKQDKVIIAVLSGNDIEVLNVFGDRIQDIEIKPNNLLRLC